MYWKNARRFINTTFHEIIICGSRVPRWGQKNVYTGGGSDWHLHTGAGRHSCSDIADAT